MNNTVRHPVNADFEHIEISIAPDFPGVVIVSLDRRRKRNAINRKLWKEIGRVFAAVTADGCCRCILLVGKGSAFCAGIDIGDPSFFPQPSEDVAHTGISFLPKLRQMQACFTAVEKCPVPVVAAIHGKCIGAGIDLVCAADVRLCSPETVFSVREVALGLAADVGTLQRLPKITGNQSIVNELCLTGRDFGSAEALSFGLVSRVTEDLYKDAMQMCATICKHSPVVVHGTKQALLYIRDHSVADGLEQIGAYNALALQSADIPEAFASLAAKQPPRFASLPAFSRL